MTEQIKELEKALRYSLMHENECAFVHTRTIQLCLETLKDREQILLDAENDAYSRGVLAGIELSKNENSKAWEEVLQELENKRDFVGRFIDTERNSGRFDAYNAAINIINQHLEIEEGEEYE